MSTNAWLSSERIRYMKMTGTVVVVDACKYGYGILWCCLHESTLSLTLPPVEGVWEPDCSTSNQFLLELRVTVVAISEFFSSNPDAEQLIVVGDNTGVMWCLKNGYCTNNLGMLELKKVLFYLARIRFITVVSKNNAADCPSRKFDPHVKDPYADFGLRMVMTGAKYHFSRLCGAANWGGRAVCG